MSYRALINAAHGFIARCPIEPEYMLFSNFPAAGAGDSFFVTIPHLLTGAVLNFPEKPETIAKDIRKIGPDFVIYKPEQWESLVSEIQVKIIGDHPLKRFFYNLFLPVGLKIADSRFKNKRPNLYWWLLNIPAYFLLFRPIRSRLGLHRVRLAASDGPVLSLEAFRFLHAIGINLRQALCYQ